MNRLLPIVCLILSALPGLSQIRPPGGGGTITTNGILASQAVAIARTNALAKVADAATPRVILLGDSMISDGGPAGSESVSQSLWRYFPSMGAAARVNLATNGGRADVLLAAFASQVGPYLSSNTYSADIAVVQLGFNDLAGGRTVAQLTNDWGQIWAGLRAGGVRRIYALSILGTNYSYGSYTLAEQTEGNAFLTNALAAGLIDELYSWHALTPDFLEGGAEVGIHPTGQFSRITATNLIADWDWTFPATKQSVVSHGEAIFSPAAGSAGSAARLKGSLTVEPGQRIQFQSVSTRPSAGLRAYAGSSEKLSIFAYELDRIIVYEDGTVTIGDLADSAYRLDVDGAAHVTDLVADNGVTGILRGKSGSIVTNVSSYGGIYFEGTSPIILRSGSGDTTPQWGRATTNAPANFITDGTISGSDITASSGVTGVLRGKSGSIVTNFSVIDGMFLEAGAPIYGRHSNLSTEVSFGRDKGGGTGILASNLPPGSFAVRTLSNDVYFAVASAGVPNWRWTDTGLTFPDGTTQTTAGGGGGGISAVSLVETNGPSAASIAGSTLNIAVRTNHVERVSLHIGSDSASLTDSQSIHWGNHGVVPTTTSSGVWCRVYVPFTGTITAVTWIAAFGSLGTSETWPTYVRVNDTTDYLVANADCSVHAVVSNTALSIPVTAGDFFSIKCVNPAWSTNPTQFRPTGEVILEIQ